MSLPLTIQPPLGSQSLGLYARACTGLAAGTGERSLQCYAQQLAQLAHIDLILVYDAPLAPSTPLRLVAQCGLASHLASKFRTLDADRSTGASGWRGAGGCSGSVDPAPLTPDLQALDLRAHCAYPVWSGGVLAGQVFFGSRRWDRFHVDTLSVFAAAALQVGEALLRQRAAVQGEQASWQNDGTGGAAHRRRQFIAVLAHELRNPIAPIRSGVDILATGRLDAEGRQSTLDMMRRQVGHLVRLIDDLLDTVRLDTGKLQVRRTPVMLSEVIRAAIESIRPALATKHQALDLDDAAAQAVVDADLVRLSQAFVHILGENVRRTPEGGVIRVSVQAKASELAVTFEDEGADIGPQEMGNVFELFPTSAEQKSQAGWGIGLALVRGLVELNDGSVHVRRRAAGDGSAYVVTLPLTQRDAAGSDPAPAGATPARPVSPGQRVLIVDDNRDAAETLSLLFELDGHAVRLAHDGPTAVAEARAFQPEVVLMDIGLPGFNGDEATRQIRAQQAPVRPTIIALTGWGAGSDRQITRRAGCDLHLVKPVSHEHLRELMRELTAAVDAEVS